MLYPPDVQDPVGVLRLELGQSQSVVPPGEGQEHV